MPENSFIIDKSRLIKMIRKADDEEILKWPERRTFVSIKKCFWFWEVMSGNGEVGDFIRPERRNFECEQKLVHFDK